MAAVSSRPFATAGPSAPRSLLPLIDMCNHSFEANCSIVKGKDETIHLVAAREVAAGEALTLSYGKLDSWQLLLNYGFQVPKNPYDHIDVALTWRWCCAAECCECSVDDRSAGRCGLTSGASAADRGSHCWRGPEGWQLERLAALGLPQSDSVVHVAVGRGTAALGLLPSGVDPRLRTAAAVLCATKACDLKDDLSPVQAASLGLLAAYVSLTLSKLGLYLPEDLVCC